MLNIGPVTLEGKTVLLRPPSSDDLNELILSASNGEIWNNPFSLFSSINEMHGYLKELLKSSDLSLPFIMIHKQLNKIVGTTRYLNIDYDNYRLEIGHTYLASYFRRTAVNTESKLLILQRIFENLNCIAVEIRRIYLMIYQEKQ